MKKLFSLVAVLALVTASNANAAEKYVGGGFEAAGSIVTGFGFQQGTTNGHPQAGFGVLGNYVPTKSAKATQFNFFVDSVELDLMKSFGENIAFRSDIDFLRSAAGVSAVALEQAYATANIPVGNGVEFMLGRFNAPIGFESVDVIANSTISQSQILRTGLRPTNLTGAKLYYAFTDMVDLHWWFANNMTTDVANPVNDTLPSTGMRLGFNWGDEGMESTFGVSGAYGYEQAKVKDPSFLGDLDWNWWLTESFAFGGEVLFRRDNKVNAAGINAETLAGLVNLTYQFSDVWDGTFKYAFTKNYDTILLLGAQVPAWGGWEGYSNEFALAGSYALADNAKVMLEGHFDWIKTGAGANVKSYDYGAALAFGYNF